MLPGRETVHVEVVASVTKPEEMKSVVSNRFNFTFEIDAIGNEQNDAKGARTLRKVVPSTPEEARRIVERYHKDTLQVQEDQM